MVELGQLDVVGYKTVFRAFFSRFDQWHDQEQAFRKLLIEVPIEHFGDLYNVLFNALGESDRSGPLKDFISGVVVDVIKEREICFKCRSGKIRLVEDENGTGDHAIQTSVCLRCNYQVQSAAIDE